jgi:membrane-associated protease RseP (regulator of RpoE activity)
MFTLLVVALGIAAIIGIHEASHMLVSKLFGVKVLKFSLGFGPILFSKQIGETSYELRILPLGGFIQCDGESPEKDTPRGFFSLRWWKRSLIALAGPTSNLILGFLLIFGLLLFNGWPIFQGLSRAYEISSFVITTTIKWIFGLTPPVPNQPAVSQLAGPIMVTKILVNSMREGFASFAFILSMISLSLGLFNLFPVPGLDGGHIALYTLEGLRGKKFSTKAYVVWNIIGFMLLIALMIFVCGMDIANLLK